MGTYFLVDLLILQTCGKTRVFHLGTISMLNFKYSYQNLICVLHLFWYYCSAHVSKCFDSAVRHTVDQGPQEILVVEEPLDSVHCRSCQICILC